MASSDCVIAVAPSSAEFCLIEDFLAEDGVQVLPASCLLEAILQQAVASAPVVIYDADSQEHWREALRQFLRVRPGTRVVFLSRLADDQMWIDVLETGGFDLLIKPFQAMEIRSVVRSALTHVRRAVA